MCRSNVLQLSKQQYETIGVCVQVMHLPNNTLKKG